MLSDTVEILTFVINRFPKKKIMGRVMLGFLAEEGGAAAWFRAALGRVLLGFLAEEGGAAVRFGAALGELCLDSWPQKVARLYCL